MIYEDEDIYFEYPSLKRKDEAIDYVNEIVMACQEFNGTGGLDKASSYENWLNHIKEAENLEYQGYDSDKYVPSITFFVIKKEDDKIIGMVNIRKFLNKVLDEKESGHIGYGIRPSEQKKGYGKKLLKLAIKYCHEELKIDVIRAGCRELNIGSKKIIESAGMKLIDRKDGIISHLYYELKL